MSPWRDDITGALAAFRTEPGLPGGPLSEGEAKVEFLPAPHKRPKWPPGGAAAIYGFWFDGEWLRIGKAGPGSEKRYTHQHYNGCAPSTLYNDLKIDPRMESVPGFDPAALGNWIFASTSRVNILLPVSRYGPFLDYLERFLHDRLKPQYEGRRGG